MSEDIRYALRTLKKSPGFTVVALITLALGIGANTAIFSVVDAVVLQPLGYAAPERIVRLQTSWVNEPDADISPAEYLDYRDELDVFSAMGVYAHGPASLTGVDRPERLRGAYVTSGVFPALGAQPRLGRFFTADEDLPGRDVAILGFDLWQRQFGGASDVPGRTVQIDGRPHTIVGVMPARFRMPADYTDGETTDVFLPLGIDPASVSDRGSHFLEGVGRLAPGVTLDGAAAAVGALARRMVERYPGDYPSEMRFSATVLPLADTVVGPVRPALLILLCAVGLVLLVACANVANLLLAKAEARSSEFALRTALGAGRTRIIRQLIVESVVLAAAGGALGVLLAFGGTEVLVALQPPDLPRIDSVSIDLRVLAFTTAIVALTGMLLGIVPALQSAGAHPAAALHEGSARSTAGRQRFRNVLVVGQIAVALVLLIGAALLVRSYGELRQVDPGYRVDHVLTTELSLPTASYPGAPEVTGFYRQLLDRVSRLPGVAAGGGVSNLPLATNLGDLNFKIEGREDAPGDVSPAADWQTVTPGYFNAMRIGLRAGRGIQPTDDADAPGVVVISENAASRYWPGENPLGRRFLLGGGAAPGWVTIVGIARDVRHAAFDAPTGSQMYLSHAQFRFWNDGGPVRELTLAIRTAGEPAALAGAIRREVAELDPALPLADFRTMDEVAAASMARPRLMMLLLTTFAAVALVLGAVGVYGVMAWQVGRRTREMGIRRALGASSREVAALVLKRSVALTAGGVAVGLVVAAVVTRALGGMLYGVTPLDFRTFAGAPLALAAVAMLAAWIPTWRATRVDPNVVLRHE